MSKMTNVNRCFCCGRTEDQVDHLVAIGVETMICDSCSDEIHDIFNRIKLEVAEEEISMLGIRPKLIKSHLDEFVVGQEEAKKVLAVEIYNHFKRIHDPSQEIEKSNILMIGNSGTGKTLLVKTMAKILNLPLAIVDASLITAAGYVGQDIESVLQQLVVAADGDLNLAERGIIFIDEIDKIAKRNLTSSTEKDPGGEGVQQGLLKILEGSEVKIRVEGFAKFRGGEAYINTTNILFICAGAFFGLEKILEKNHNDQGHGIGFSASVDKNDMAIDTMEVNEEDLIEYGFIPEFSSRLPVIVRLTPLSIDDFKRILTEPKNSIVSQYQKLLKLDGIDLEFSEPFLDQVAATAHGSKRGARALRGEIERHMRDIIYNISEDDEGRTIRI